MVEYVGGLVGKRTFVKHEKRRMTKQKSRYPKQNGFSLKQQKHKTMLKYLMSRWITPAATIQ
jgi:hypothetical protein